MSDVTNDQLTTADFAYGKRETTEEKHDTDNRLDGQQVEPDEREDETVAVSEASLLPDEDRSKYQEHWDSIQTESVDEPKQSVQEADALVADVTNDQLTTADLAYGKPEMIEEKHDTDNRLDGQHVEPDEREDETVAASEASLLEDRSKYQEQWDSIQTKFVDEPKQSVQEADALVADVIQQLATKFAESLKSLEQQWGSDGEVSTEDLRQTLQHYRSFFQRLLAA